MTYEEKINQIEILIIKTCEDFNIDYDDVLSSIEEGLNERYGVEDNDD